MRDLRGEDIPNVATRRHGYGNSKVLAPKYRNLENACAVSRWLVEKAAARLRRDGRAASEFSMQLSCMPLGWWSDSITSCNCSGHLGTRFSSDPRCGVE